MKKAIVLFDGNCSLCQKTVKTIGYWDIFKQIRFINFLSPQAKPVIDELGLKIEDLLYDMHIVEGKKSWKGYEAYQRISLCLPLCWVLVPFLYFPPIKKEGMRIYRGVADSRTCQVASGKGE